MDRETTDKRGERSWLMGVLGSIGPRSLLNRMSIFQLIHGGPGNGPSIFVSLDSPMRKGRGGTPYRHSIAPVGLGRAELKDEPPAGGIGNGREGKRMKLGLFDFPGQDSHLPKDWTF